MSHYINNCRYYYRYDKRNKIVTKRVLDESLLYYSFTAKEMLFFFENQKKTSIKFYFYVNFTTVKNFIQQFRRLFRGSFFFVDDNFFYN